MRPFSDISYSRKPSISWVKDNQSFSAIPFCVSKSKVIWIEDSDEKQLGNEGNEEGKDEIIFYKEKKYSSTAKERVLDPVMLPQISKKSSRDLQDNTLPTKTQSAYKKSASKNNNCPSPDLNGNLNLGSAEDLLNHDLLRKITVAPKVNPRLRIIKEEEQKFSSTFALNPKDDSIKKLDEECNDFSQSLAQFDDSKREESKSASSHCEDLQSHERTEFYQYSTPQGKFFRWPIDFDFNKEIMNEDFVFRPKDLWMYNTSEVLGSGKISFRT